MKLLDKLERFLTKIFNPPAGHQVRPLKKIAPKWSPKSKLSVLLGVVNSTYKPLEVINKELNKKTKSVNTEASLRTMLHTLRRYGLVDKFGKNYVITEQGIKHYLYIHNQCK